MTISYQEVIELDASPSAPPELTAAVEATLEQIQSTEDGQVLLEALSDFYSVEDGAGLNLYLSSNNLRGLSFYNNGTPTFADDVVSIDMQSMLSARIYYETLPPETWLGKAFDLIGLRA